MGYYTRVFCISSEIPTLSEIGKQLQSTYKECRIESSEGNSDSDWDSFSLHYKPGKLPLLVEVNRVTDEDNLAKEEIEEFIDSVGTSFFSLSKRKVINHLMKSQYIVASQLPTSDIDDDGYEANGALLQLFVRGYGGIVQADNEGFYDGNKLIVKDK